MPDFTFKPGDVVQVRDLRDGQLAAENATVVDRSEALYLIREQDGLSYWVAFKCVEPQGYGHDPVVDARAQWAVEGYLPGSAD